jgi:hypothetical protein
MDATINLVICTPSEFKQWKILKILAPSECNASEADLTINLNSTLKKVDAALTEAVIVRANCAPSEFEIRMNVTTNWKELSLKEVDSMKVLCPCATIRNTLHK